ERDPWHAVRAGRRGLTDHEANLGGLPMFQFKRVMWLRGAAAVLGLAVLVSGLSFAAAADDEPKKEDKKAKPKKIVTDDDKEQSKQNNTKKGIPVPETPDGD